MYTAVTVSGLASFNLQRSPQIASQPKIEKQENLAACDTEMNERINFKVA